MKTRTNCLTRRVWTSLIPCIFITFLVVFVAYNGRAVKHTITSFSKSKLEKLIKVKPNTNKIHNLIVVNSVSNTKQKQLRNFADIKQELEDLDDKAIVVPHRKGPFVKGTIKYITKYVAGSIPNTKIHNILESKEYIKMNDGDIASSLTVSKITSDISKGSLSLYGNQQNYTNIGNPEETANSHRMGNHSDNNVGRITNSRQAIGKTENDVLSGKTNPQKVVLLLTYLRSGSTLTADIIQQVPGVFYAYEPLKRYVANDTGYISLDGICSMNNLTCRQPVLLSELPQAFVEDIVRYYGCDLEHLTGNFLWSESSSSVKQYKDCIRATTQLKADSQFCLNQCVRSTRYLKTIRLSMDVVEILMKIIPKLKVVHLLRDPRGMIYSRKRGGFVKKWMSLTTVAQSVCRRFERDIEIAAKLRRIYPGRLKTYLYEQIAEHPKIASTSLFKFLSLTAPADFDAWLHQHTAAGLQGNYYGTVRPNSTVTANNWRLRMPYSEVSEIDNECSKFYNYTGILKAESEHLLRDLTLQLRLPSPEFGDFL